MSRPLWILSTPLLLVALTQVHAATPTDSLGKKVPDFQLKDTTGKAVALADLKDRRAVVVIFIGTECPINNAYMPRLAELHREFAPQAAQFLAVNANRQDTLERIAEHARKHALPFPVLKDDGNRVADSFAAARTPEVFVLDAELTIRYRGRIDDQYGIGYKRAKATRRDLAEALQEVLAGKTVSQAALPVSGCRIARQNAVKDEGPITFSKHVAAILQKHCQECHRPGQIGPMPLLTYDDAVAWSETIREVIEDRRMPPWHADPRYGKFSTSRCLSDEDRQTLLHWLEQGTPRGDDRELPPPRIFPEGWTIGKPDLVLTMPEEFAVPAEAPKGGVPYKHFFVDTGFKEDRWVERSESRAGAPSVVHHILIFILPPGKRFFPGAPGNPVLGGTAPGDMPLMLAPGTAKKIPAGSQLVFQMHYTPNGVACKDRSSVALIFAKQHPERRVHTVPIPNLRLFIPPGDDNYQSEAWFRFKEDAHVIGFMPHMHVRGKDFLYEAVYPDGKKEILLSVPRYDFNWQTCYRCEKPVPMPKGTKIHCVAHFDNSAKNPNNPDPTRMVFWGDQTWEEMMIGWLDFYYDRKAE